jgi:D-threonate/D-erythronate kinase
MRVPIIAINQCGIIVPSLRLLADDLTGALDTAAEFVGLCGPLEVVSAGALPANIPQSLAIDSETREHARTEAVEVVRGLAPLLRGATIAYKKIDSLMRGAWAAELATCWKLGAWQHCVVAPAFPYQGRRTQAGRQFARMPDGSWRTVSGDLIAALRTEGVAAVMADPAEPLTDGIGVFDAETDEDLDRVVAATRGAAGPVIWCGSGGLARALARGHEIEASTQLKRPVLGLFGSDQPATVAQLAACEMHRIRLTGGRDQIRAIERRLATAGVALVSLDLPKGISRGDATRRIHETLGSVAATLGPPGTLIISGGETFKGLCTSLGARSLLVSGHVVPGLPRSLMQGGRWDGVEIVSKSGAFGPPELWRDLLTQNGLICESIEA